MGVSWKVTSFTGLTGSDAIGQFFKSSSVVAHETEKIDLIRGYWMSMTKYTHKVTGIPFLFFNSHWMHNYGAEQKVIIANAIDAQRKKHAFPPTILVGDTNQFCMAHELEALKYLTGEEGSSPVVFIDTIGQDKGSSYDGGCRIDFILASKGQWFRVDSFIDRDGMGVHGSASDHAALMAELVPVSAHVPLRHTNACFCCWVCFLCISFKPCRWYWSHLSVSKSTSSGGVHTCIGEEKENCIRCYVGAVPNMEILQSGNG